MKRLFLSLWLLALALSPQLAGAHATPTLYEPAASAILSASPERVRIMFSERVEPSASSIVVYAPGGTRADDEHVVIDPADAHVLSVGAHGSGSGTYAVSWQVVSADDGHFTKGAFVYSVGEESEQAGSGGNQFQVIHKTDLPEAATLFLELLGQTLLLGGLLLHAFLWRALRCGNQERTYAKRFTAFMAAGALLTILGGALYLFYRSYGLSTENGFAFAQNFQTFLFTVSGRFAAERMGLALLFLATFVPLRKPLFKAEKFSGTELWLAAIVALMALLRARVSHAAASAFLPVFSIGVNFVHLLGKEGWIGAVTAFALLLFPLLDRRGDARDLGIGFTMLSRVVAIMFGIGGVTGAYIVWLHLKSPANILATHWGMEFLSLTIFALLLLLLRLYQQYRVDRATVAYCGGRPGATDILRGAGFLVTTEMLVGMAVLFLSSLLIITTPPLGHRTVFERTVATQGTTVTFEEHPYDDAQFLVSVADERTANIVVTLTNEEKGIGPIVAPLEKRFPGVVVFPKKTLSPAGVWKIDVTAVRPDSYDTVASFTIKHPSDLEKLRSADAGRSLDPFTLLSIAIALGILLSAVLLYRFSTGVQRLAVACDTKAIESIGLRGAQFWIIFFSDIALIILLAVHLSTHTHGTFQQACIASGGTWHENVPMRKGVATSNAAVLGCMVGSGRGQYHFADAREFAEFLRPAQAVASMQTDPKQPRAGEHVLFTVGIKDLQGNPVKDLRIEHDRILHVIIVGQDRIFFDHTHVEDLEPVTPSMLEAATFPVHYVFPKAGRYLVAVDFTVRAQTFQQEFYVTVAGSPQMQVDALSDALAPRLVETLDVRLIKPETMQAGSPQKFSFAFTQSGAPVIDLTPYLSAPMHLAIVRDDLRKFQHTHAELPQTLWQRIVNPRNPKAKHLHTPLPERFGPTLDAYITFPSPGTYVIFGEFMREGYLHRVRFVVKAE
jgi:methionine-rich copper-binding protein CopC